MKKWGYIISFVIIFVVAVFTGKYIFDSSNKVEEESENDIYGTRIIEEEPYSVRNEVTIQTTTTQEKVSPNATLILKKHYLECGHTIKEYAEVPEDFVNLTEEELEKEYEEWDIEQFSNLEITLIKEEDGVCNEHYILKEINGVIGVYRTEESGDEELIEETGISIEYLTQEDKMKISEGIKVYGKEDLNSTLEDYE